VLCANTIDDVEQLVHLDVALALDRPVDVFAEHNRWGVLSREAQRLCQLIRTLAEDVGPGIPIALLGSDIRCQCLASTVWPCQQDSALQGNSALPAALGMLDQGEEVDPQGVFDGLWQH
jgi:hypothetical protein